MEYTFKDGWQRGVKPTLWIVQRGKIYPFKGDSIPDVVNVLGTKPAEEDGRVVVTYALRLVEGATPCPLVASPHGRLWPEGDIPSAHERFKKRFGVRVPISEFNAIMARCFSPTYDRMVNGEEVPTLAEWRSSSWEEN